MRQNYLLQIYSNYQNIFKQSCWRNMKKTWRLHRSILRNCADLISFLQTVIWKLWRSCWIWTKLSSLMLHHLCADNFRFQEVSEELTVTMIVSTLTQVICTMTWSRPAATWCRPSSSTVAPWFPPSSTTAWRSAGRWCPRWSRRGWSLFPPYWSTGAGWCRPCWGTGETWSTLSGPTPGSCRSQSL